MASDPALMRSLEAALERDPSQLPLRLHLAALYLDGADPARAMSHADVVLAAHPAHVEAIGIAARAARLLGQAERAEGFERLAAALSEGPRQSQPSVDDAGSQHQGVDEEDTPVTEPVPIAPSGAHHDELDDFLAELLGGAAVERPHVTLADVGGLTAVKKRLITSFLGPMRNPKLREMYATSLRGGLLLYGPPGCGKTFLARAVAGELGAKFFGVGLHDVLDMWLGKSEQNLHDIFETARRNAPCVLFMDEVDALGMKRSNLTRSAGRNVVVQLLSELDSTRNDNDGVFFLGATNQPWDIDPALRRPGRFDRMLLVLPPDEPARVTILEYHMRDRPLGRDVHVERLAKRTNGYSGADLRLLCEAAAQAALEASVESGTARPISSEDFETALRDIKPSVRPWFDMARNYAMFANDGGVYDDLLTFMRRNRLA